MVHDEVLFLETEAAHPGGGVEGLAAGKDPPGDCEGDLLVLQLPHMVRQSLSIYLSGVFRPWAWEIIFVTLT